MLLNIPSTVYKEKKFNKLSSLKISIKRFYFSSCINCFCKFSSFFFYFIILLLYISSKLFLINFKILIYLILLIFQFKCLLLFLFAIFHILIFFVYLLIIFHALLFYKILLLIFNFKPIFHKLIRRCINIIKLNFNFNYI